MALNVELVPAGNWQVLEGDRVLKDDITTREEADAFVAGYEAKSSGKKATGINGARKEVDLNHLADSPAASGRPSPQRLKSPTKAEEAGPDVIERHVEESNAPGDTKPNRERVPDEPAR